MNYYGINKKYVQYLANITAQKVNMNCATKILFKNCKKPYVKDYTQFGYRKFTTDEYVPNSYMRKFGWKNCYYQSAECIVVLPLRYKEILKRD
jgi:hypothetical protein